MAARIRLRRVGASKQPSYRVVVADVRAPRNGRFIETIGFYNPLTEPPAIKIEAEKVRMWLDRGAQPSNAVIKLLRRAGLADSLGVPLPEYQRAQGGAESPEGPGAPAQDTEATGKQETAGSPRRTGE